MRRAAAIALAALLSVPGAAAGQFRARPLVVPAPEPQLSSSARALLAGAFATAPAPGEPALADLLLADLAPTFRAHHALLAPRASPVAQPASPFRCVAAGRLAENADDALADVVYCAGALNELQIAFGDAPGALRSYTHTLGTIGTTPELTFARLHPAPRTSDVIVLPVDTGRGLPNEGLLYALDVGVAAGAPAMTDRSWPARSIGVRAVLPDEVLTLRISPVARQQGIDDLYIPGFGSVTLYAHASAPAGRTLADVDFGAAPVKIGGTAAEGLDPSQWLPAGVGNNDVLGAAALDVDLDGDLDLVLVLSPSAACPATDPACAGRSTPPGRLLWVERTGDVASLATARPWRDLGAHPDLQPLVDPALVRALDLGGEPAVAVFDRGTDSVLVVTADAGAGRLRVWRGSAAGRELRALRLADVVGSPAPDLVADATVGTYFGTSVERAVLVWPDAGDASPELAWAGDGLGEPVRGEDLPLTVSARDADGPFTVDWILGDDPYAAPAASTPDVPGGGALELTWVVDGALLCEAPPQTIAVTVRATDALGVWDELGATADVGFRRPELELAGAVPPGRLALPPGGTVATLEGSAWARCGGATFTWGGSLLAAAAGIVVEDGAGTTRRILQLPESTYPALLSIAPEATLLATDPATGLESPAATLAVSLAAGDLVAAEHSADAVALAPGEVTVVRTRLRSRLGVALPDVRLVHALAGLAPAGAPRVAGASVVATAAGGAEVVLDALPPGAEVTVELPVRSLGARGTSAVEVRSSGGHLLTPAAAAAASDAPPPGCGCGAGGAGLEGLLAVAALAALAPRRRRPT